MYASVPSILMYVILHIVLKKPHLFFGLATGDRMACGAWLSAYCLLKVCCKMPRCIESGRCLSAGVCCKLRLANDANDRFEAIELTCACENERVDCDSEPRRSILLAITGSASVRMRWSKSRDVKLKPQEAGWSLLWLRLDDFFLDKFSGVVWWRSLDR